MYVPRVESSGKGCGQEEDLGLVRTASMVAVRGSSSSDPNPSDSSVECDCCKQSTDLGQVDSNKSTYGSSDIKDSSDVSSYNSNFTPDKSPQSSDSEKCQLGSLTPLPPVRSRPGCVLGRGRREADRGEARSHSRLYGDESSDRGDQSDPDRDGCTVCQSSDSSFLYKFPSSFPSRGAEASHFLANAVFKGNCTLSTDNGSYNPCTKHKTVILHRSQTFVQTRDTRTATSGVRLGTSALSNAQMFIPNRQNKLSAPAYSTPCKIQDRYSGDRNIQQRLSISGYSAVCSQHRFSSSGYSAVKNSQNRLSIPGYSVDGKTQNRFNISGYSAESSTQNRLSIPGYSDGKIQNRFNISGYSAESSTQNRLSIPGYSDGKIQNRFNISGYSAESSTQNRLSVSGYSAINKTQHRLGLPAHTVCQPEHRPGIPPHRAGSQDHGASTKSFTTTKQYSLTAKHQSGSQTGFYPVQQQNGCNSSDNTVTPERLLHNHDNRLFHHNGSTKHDSFSNTDGGSHNHDFQSINHDFQSGNHDAQSGNHDAGVCSGAAGAPGYPRVIRPTPYRARVCPVCQQMAALPAPRRSMVLFTEPEGECKTQGHRNLAFGTFLGYEFVTAAQFIQHF